MWDEYRLCMKECGEEKQLALYCLQKAMETGGGFNDQKKTKVTHILKKSKQVTASR